MLSNSEIFQNIEDILSILYYQRHLGNLICTYFQNRTRRDLENLLARLLTKFLGFPFENAQSFIFICLLLFDLS